MKVKWLARAEAMREHQVEYIAQANPYAAAALGDIIEAAQARLMEFPQIGRPGRVAGTRVLSVPQTPFIIVYREQRTHLLIIRFLHRRQKWPRKP